MHSSFRWKLTGTYLVIILVILFITGIILSVSFKDYYLENSKANLIKESVLVAEMTRFYDQQTHIAGFLQGICNTAARDTDTRVTIVDAQGKVLGDSMHDPQTMEPHNTRPEIHQALQGKTGEDIRMSDTLNIRMLYVAVPFNNGSISGAVRLSKPLSEVEAIYRNILYILLLAVILTGLIAFVISIGVAEKFSRPLEDITNIVEDMAQGNLKKRISYQSNDELGTLASVVNNMAEYLDKNINEISEVKNRLEALLDNTVNGILMVDTGGKVTYANPVALSLLSIDRNFMGRKHVEVITNYELLEIIDKVKEKCEPVRREIVLHTRGEKTVEVNVVPLINKEISSHDGVLVVLNDITDIKRLEQVRKDFVANVSHELKTPVATISGFAETLLSEGRRPENVQNVHEFSSIIYEEAQRLKRLIDRLLELSRLESGRSELNIESVNMGDLIDNAIKIVQKRSDFDRKVINFDKREEGVYIDADPDLIVQVLVNLLDNAINYSPEDKEIIVTLENRDKDVKVTVQDQGEGIPEKERSSVSLLHL